MGLLLKRNERDWGDNMRTAQLRINENEGLSLQRPAWTQYDLHAYKHRHFNGRIGIVKDWFAKRKGAVRT